MDDIRLQFISVKWHNQSQQDNSEDNVVMIIKAPGENSKKNLLIISNIKAKIIRQNVLDFLDKEEKIK